jgi:predicted Zn-dependent protease
MVAAYGEASPAYQRGDTAAAIAMLRAVIERKGANASRCGALGTLLGRENQWQEALEYARAAVALSGRDVRCVANEAVTLWKNGRFDEALQSFGEAEVRCPEDTVNICKGGQMLLELGRFDEAILALRRAENQLFALARQGTMAAPDQIQAAEDLRSRLRDKGLEIA